MTIHFTGGSEALRTFTIEKFEKLYKLAHNITDIHVIFKVDKLRHIAEANLHVPNFPPINAECESENMYKTIDLLIDKLKSQLGKHKEKITNHG